MTTALISSSPTTMRIAVYGAGAIGCFVGGALANSGCDVTLLVRQRIFDEIASSGLTLQKLDGDHVFIASDSIRFVIDPNELRSCDVVLVCVKCGQTEQAGAALSTMLAPGTLVVSLQNGLHNAEILQRQLTQCTVLAGIVGFNVVALGTGIFRQATSGELTIEKSSNAKAIELVRRFRRADLHAIESAKIQSLQWGKLLMNLNNAVSALSDRPTVELLLQRDYRTILAALIAEALKVLSSSKIAVGKVGPLSPRWMPWMLRMPSFALRLLMGRNNRIDPLARSSMWADLTGNKLTEVDFLNGEILTLAASTGVQAPMNAIIVALVHAAEKASQGSPNMSALQLREALGIR
jgi:2-dehydropantoate 2-reductase